MCRFYALWVGLISLGFFGLTPQVRSLELQDNFEDRESSSDPDGNVVADSSFATTEPDEPRHADKRSGHSMWMTWIAPSDGIVSFSTDESDFDTVLAAYFFRSQNDSQTFDRLREIARADDDDDDEGEIQFGVIQGQAYEIAVAGYGNDSGLILLQWSFISTATVPPVVLEMPDDRSIVIGEPLILSVDFDDEFGSIDDDDIDLRWYFNGDELEDEESPTLTIPSFQIADVGLYSLQMRIENVRFVIASAEIQINSEGAISVLARSKLLDALGSRLSDGGVLNGNTPPGSPIINIRQLAVRQADVSRGFSGSQIFSTIYALPQPGEPIHCDVPGGSSYWFAYEPPQDGLLSVDTQGSTFPTILAVYTWNVADPQFSDLIPLTCQHATGVGSQESRVALPVNRGQKLAIVVDGVAGATGIAHLNYNLDVNAVIVTPPEISVHPRSQLIAIGSPVILDVQVTGTPPLEFQWFRNGNPIDGAVSPEFIIPSASLADSGQYSVNVIHNNSFVSSDQAQIIVHSRPAIRNSNGIIRFSPGEELALDLQSAPLESCCFQWFKDGVLIPDHDETSPALVIQDAQLAQAGTYQFKLVTPMGTLSSSEVAVQAVTPLRIFPATEKGLFNLEWIASPGVDYIVQASDGLTPGNWISIAEGQSDGTGLVIALDLMMPVQYFRLVLP